MENISKRLSNKVEELISRYEASKAENAALKEELARKDRQLQSTTKKLNELETEIGNLRLKEAFLGLSADPAQAKKRVALLIKEIDSCIALLSD